MANKPWFGNQGGTQVKQRGRDIVPWTAPTGMEPGEAQKWSTTGLTGQGVGANAVVPEQLKYDWSRMTRIEKQSAVTTTPWWTLSDAQFASAMMGLEPEYTQMADAYRKTGKAGQGINYADVGKGVPGVGEALVAALLAYAGGEALGALGAGNVVGSQAGKVAQQIATQGERGSVGGFPVGIETAGQGGSWLGSAGQAALGFGKNLLPTTARELALKAGGAGIGGYTLASWLGSGKGGGNISTTTDLDTLNKMYSDLVQAYGQGRITDPSSWDEKQVKSQWLWLQDKGMFGAIPGNGLLTTEGAGTDTGVTTTPEIPQIVEVGGRKFWYDPASVSWQPLEASPEEQLAQYVQQLQAEAQAEQLKIYAEDPYKYYIQNWLSQNPDTMPATPSAVGTLQGVGAGQPLKTIPLSTPSAQWWGGLMPNEQQQVLGTLNWMGIDPDQWLAMYRKMLPGGERTTPIQYRKR